MAGRTSGRSEADTSLVVARITRSLKAPTFMSRLRDLSVVEESASREFRRREDPHDLSVSPDDVAARKMVRGALPQAVNGVLARTPSVFARLKS